MPIAAPADKRFRRAHATPARRRPGLSISWAKAARAAVVLAVVLYGGYRATGLLFSEALTITRITVDGNTRMSRGEVLTLLDGLSGKNMVTADLEQWRQKLLGSPWVADAKVRRVLPGTVAVVISEREPMAIGRIGELLYLLDQGGGIIDEFGPNYAEFDLPIVSGLGPVRPDGAPRVDDARATLAGRVIAAVQTHPDLARRLSEIDVTDAHDAAVILKGDTALVRIGEDQFAERLQSYIDLVPALRARIPDIDYVDLRFDERVYVRPQGRVPGPGKPQAESRRR